MRLETGMIALVAALAAGSAQSATVEIREAVARVTVIPEARSDIKIQIIRPNGSLPLTVRTMGDRTILDGDLGRRIRNCRSSGTSSSVDVRGAGNIGWQDMPQVVIRTPRDTNVEAAGAVFGTVGRSGSLTLDNAGCGDWTIANVDGEARISQAGSGDTRIGTSGSLRVRVAGSGDVAAAAVRNGLDVNIAGSGSARVASASGPLDINVAGSGDVVIGGGTARDLKVSIAGSGDVHFRGTAASLRARIAGSGDVHADAVTGAVSKTVMGSGTVRIGN